VILDLSTLRGLRFHIGNLTLNKEKTFGELLENRFFINFLHYVRI